MIMWPRAKRILLQNNLYPGYHQTSHSRDQNQKKQTSTNSRVTELLVEPLSKKAQLSSPSIWTKAILSGPFPQLSELGFKKETFWDVLRLWDPHLGILVGWLLVSEGSGLPSSLPPLSCLNYFFWWPCWDPLYSLSQDGQEWQTQNNSSFSSGTAQLYWQNRWYSWLADLPHQFHSGSLSLLILKNQPLLLLPNLHMSPSSDQAVKVWFSFSFLEGNKFPDACGWVTFDPPVVVVFRSRGSLASSQFSNIWAARFAIYFVSQHALIFGVQALIEMISFHLLHVILLYPSQILWLEYLNLLWQVHSKLSHILPKPCLKEYSSLLRALNVITMPQYLSNVCKMSIKVASSPKLLVRCPGNPCNDQKNIWQKVLVIPTWVVEDSYVPLPWRVSTASFVFSSWRLTDRP